MAGGLAGELAGRPVAKVGILGLVGKVGVLNLDEAMALLSIKGGWRAHMGADSRGGEECYKNCYIPKNGSRGGDTFCPPRGGVKGEKGGNQIFAE